MKILVLGPASDPDYLADLVYCEIISSGRYVVESNYLPDFYFSDYDNPHNLYGRGYTVFAKLNPLFRDRVSLIDSHQIQERLLDRVYDRVIYTSIWRFYGFYDYVKQSYSRDSIIVFDGEDHTRVVNVAFDSLYFKRELIAPFDQVCRPVSFAYPSYFSPDFYNNEPKCQLLAPCFPYLTSSYIFSTEESYYNQYKKSHFGVTSKKMGWDCMRHYEIIKAGAIPYFSDIVEKPSTTMITYPVALQIEANQIFNEIMRSPSLVGRFEAELENITNEFYRWLDNHGHSTIYHSLIN